MESRTEHAEAITVLHTLRPPDGTTKYVDHVINMAPPGVEVRLFSWRRALVGRYDVLHLHWPEFLLRGSTARLRTIKRLATMLVLVRVRILRTPVVRTLHNTQPHESGSPVERLLLRAIDADTDLFILLNPTTVVGTGRRSTVILHGHYRDRFADHPRSRAQPGLVVYAGIIRPYKGVERLVALSDDLAAHGISIRLVGSPSATMRPDVELAARERRNLSARLEFVSDADLVAEVTAGELVVLPYRNLHNSGALLVALSLDRPVLVPRTPSSEAMLAEVGPRWVHLYDGELEVADVVAAIERCRADAGADGPALQGRDWPELGRLHSEAYEGLLRERQR